MSERFVRFLFVARWASAIVALLYHLRFLQFVDYNAVQAKTTLSKVFYFVTGLGHESFAVFFVIDGIVAGLILLRHRASGSVDRAAVSRHLGALYRVLLPGLFLGAVLDATGVRFFSHAGLYTAFPEFSTLTLSAASLLGNLFMLQPFVVPTFGSNGMLYLLSYLFWCFVLFALFVHAERLGKPRGHAVQAALLILVVLFMPYQFLSWAAIWLMGIAVIFLGESRILRPPLPLAIACFVGALALSRLLGAAIDTEPGLLPEALGAWLLQNKYLLVGAAFAALARAMYPEYAPRGASPFVTVVSVQDGRAGQIASLTFFCHFPVMMLIAAAGSALLGQPLMRQPSAAAYGVFALLAGACLAVTVTVARTVAGTRHELGHRPSPVRRTH
jgi:hypothetical protein